MKGERKYDYRKESEKVVKFYKTLIQLVKDSKLLSVDKNELPADLQAFQKSYRRAMLEDKFSSISKVNSGGKDLGSRINVQVNETIQRESEKSQGIEGQEGEKTQKSAKAQVTAQEKTIHENESVKNALAATIPPLASNIESKKRKSSFNNENTNKKAHTEDRDDIISLDSSSSQPEVDEGKDKENESEEDGSSGAESASFSSEDAQFEDAQSELQSGPPAGPESSVVLSAQPPSQPLPLPSQPRSSNRPPVRHTSYQQLQDYDRSRNYSDNRYSQPKNHSSAPLVPQRSSSSSSITQRSRNNQPFQPSTRHDEYNNNQRPPQNRVPQRPSQDNRQGQNQGFPPGFPLRFPGFPPVPPGVGQGPPPGLPGFPQGFPPGLPTGTFPGMPFMNGFPYPLVPPVPTPPINNNNNPYAFAPMPSSRPQSQPVNNNEYNRGQQRRNRPPARSSDNTELNRYGTPEFGDMY